MSLKLTFLFVSISFIISSCKIDENRELTISSLSIDLDITDNTNTLNWKILNIDDGRVFCYYNHQSHQIIIHSLDKDKPKMVVQLEHEGPDQIEVSDFILLDSLIVAIGLLDIKYANYSGKVMDKMSITSDVDFNGKLLQARLAMPNGRRFENSIIQADPHLYPLSVVGHNLPADLLKIAIVDLGSKGIKYRTISTIPDYHRKLHSLQNYPVIYQHFLARYTIFKNQIAISFPLKGDVCTCDLYESETWTCFIPYSTQSDPINVYTNYDGSKKSIINLLEGNIFFGPIHYDQYNDQFVRVSTSAVVDNKTSSILTIYDNKWNSLYEKKLPKELLSSSLSIQSDGIYFKVRPMNEDTLEFRIFKLE